MKAFSSMASYTPAPSLWPRATFTQDGPLI